MLKQTHELNMSKWAFSKLKPHLKENIRTTIRPSDDPTHIFVLFEGFTSEQKKNIDDIAECLAIPAERSISQKNKEEQKPKAFVLEDVAPPDVTKDIFSLTHEEEKIEEREKFYVDRQN